MGFQSSIGGYTVTDEVWIAASDTGVNRIIGNFLLILQKRLPIYFNIYFSHKQHLEMTIFIYINKRAVEV